MSKITETRDEVEGQVRCAPFGAHTCGTHRVLVDADNLVLVWDDVAGHYTRVHRLSNRTQARIAAKIRAETLA